MNPATGRPRDPRVDQALQQTLVEILAERGPDGFSIDDLAARSGVSKAAIYRRYSCRDDLVAAGLAAVNDSMPEVADLELKPALVRLLTWIVGSHASGMTPTWLFAIQQMPEVKDLYATKVIGPRRAAVRQVLERAQDEGLLQPAADLDVLLTCLIAPAVLIGMHRARDYPSSAVSVEAVVDTVLAGALSPAALASGW